MINYIKRILPTSLFIKIQYYRVMKKKLNLKKPEGFNEKIQYIKIYDKNDKYTMLVDKLKVKEYVSKIIGEKHIIKNLGVWSSFEEIEFDKLPNSFVLKCNHDSGSYVIVKDKQKLDMNYAKKRLESSLQRNFYDVGREWAYKNVEPKIMAEEYIVDSKTKELNDYKFYCFNGVVDCVMVCTDRDSYETKFYFFDKNWKFKKYNKSSLTMPDDFTMKKPEKFDEMILIAEKLSSGLEFVRLDLYYVDGIIYFGEYTLYPLSGYDPNLLPEADEYFGSKINLS